MCLSSSHAHVFDDFPKILADSRLSRARSVPVVSILSQMSRTNVGDFPHLCLRARVCLPWRPDPVCTPNSCSKLFSTSISSALKQSLRVRNTMFFQDRLRVLFKISYRHQDMHPEPPPFRLSPRASLLNPHAILRLCNMVRQQ